jgi:integrase
VLGLRWSDIDLSAGTVTIGRSRVLVDGRVIEKSPKSRRSWRVLPLFGPLAGALEALQATQMAELDAAGPAYANSGYVVADELGRPVHPEWYTDEFHRLCKAAGLPRIRLHDTRSTMNSILERLGVPDTLRGAWLGHTIAVNRGSYLARPEDLTPVGDIFRPV